MMNLRKLFISLFAIGITVAGNTQTPNIGNPVYDISLPTQRGDTLKLSTLKGKVVLLDFWASWCPPCRNANRDMGKLYSAYKTKGFEIYSVSIDDNASAWKKAIARDKITWLQVNDRGGWEAATARKWGIEAIPAQFLIDKAGNIMPVELEKTELDRAVKKLLEE